jgi:hypothetical protein
VLCFVVLCCVVECDVVCSYNFRFTESVSDGNSMIVFAYIWMHVCVYLSPYVCVSLSVCVCVCVCYLRC